MFRRLADRRATSGVLGLVSFQCAAGLALAFAIQRWPLPTVGVGVVAVMGGVAVRYRLRPFEIAVVLMPFMFYVPLAGKVNVSASDIVVVPVAVCAVLTVKRARHVAPGLRVGVLYAVILVSSMVVSIVVALLFIDGTDSVGAMLAIGKVVVCLVYFLVAVAFFTYEPARLRIRALRLWVGVALVIAVASIADQLGLLRWTGTSLRSTGTFQDPNLYASYLLATAVVATWLNVARHDRLIGWNNGVLALAVLTTASRGALATLGALVIVLATYRAVRGPNLWSVARGILGLVGLWTLSRVNLDSLFVVSRLNSPAGADSDIRFTLWSAGLRGWLEYPVTGLGPGGFERVSSSLANVSGDYVTHNTFISFLTEGGVLGVLAFIWVFVYVLARTVHTPWLGVGRKYVLVLGVATVACQMMTLNLQNARFIWVLAAFILSAASSGQPGADPSESRTEPTLAESLRSDG